MISEKPPAKQLTLGFPALQILTLLKPVCKQLGEPRGWLRVRLQALALGSTPTIPNDICDKPETGTRDHLNANSFLKSKEIVFTRPYSGKGRKGGSGPCKNGGGMLLASMALTISAAVSTPKAGSSRQTCRGESVCSTSDPSTFPKVKKITAASSLPALDDPRTSKLYELSCSLTKDPAW